MNIKRPWSSAPNSGHPDDGYIITDAEDNYIGIIEKEDVAAFIVSAVNTTTIKGS